MATKRKYSIDLSLLRTNRDFRNLWISGLISYFGSMITYVAIPFQIKDLTHSYLAVGISGAVELMPLIIFGLYGGMLADSIDRKIMLWSTEAACLIFSAILLVNSLQGKPSLLLIYIVIGLFATSDGLQRPSADAILPRIVSHQEIPSASALMSLRWQFGMIVGPSIAGVIIATSSVSIGFALDVVTFVFSLAFLARVRSIPPLIRGEKPSFVALGQGFKYAFSRQELIGTYVIDLAAMFFAMPMALYPFWADKLNAPWSLGLFYAAGTVGSLVMTLTSGWISNYRFHGRAIIWGAVGWGSAIAFAGLSNSLFWVLIFLTIAGGADMISGLFRGAIWNQTIPDHLRGRLAGIELLSFSVGPLSGQVRAATMATATSLSFSVTSGGLMCVIAVFVMAAFLPKFRKYDVETNEHAVAERDIRKSREGD